MELALTPLSSLRRSESQRKPTQPSDLLRLKKKRRVDVCLGNGPGARSVALGTSVFWPEVSSRNQMLRNPTATGLFFFINTIVSFSACSFQKKKTATRLQLAAIRPKRTPSRGLDWAWFRPIRVTYSGLRCAAGTRLIKAFSFVLRALVVQIISWKLGRVRASCCLQSWRQRRNRHVQIRSENGLGSFKIRRYLHESSHGTVGLGSDRQFDVHGVTGQHELVSTRD